MAAELEFAFSRLRPSGDKVGSTGGVASGPVSFIRPFDTATDVVKQGGTRRGANMGVLHVTHPDIMQFVTSKADGDLQNFNISVMVTDDFMDAVHTDSMYWLINPATKECVKEQSAREVFHAIIAMAWQTGDPGLLFIDRINSKGNPNPHLGLIEATNPCFAGDNWIATSDGMRQVKDLVGIPFDSLIGEEAYPSTDAGFFTTGVRQVVKITTKEGYSLRVTPEHKIWKVDVGVVSATELEPGDKIQLS